MHFFKNLVIYQFTKLFDLTAEQLEEKLQSKPLRPCGSQDMSTYGWAPVFDSHAPALVHSVNGCLFIQAGKEEKILPASVIRDTLTERIETIEQEQDRQVFSKEKKTLKDDVIMELLPKAFTKRSYTRAYIDASKGWMVIDACSFNRAEDLTSCLRECIGGLPILPPEVANVPAAVMTQWLSSEKLPDNFHFGHDCELVEMGDAGGKVTAKEEDLTSDAISQHLEEGKQVNKLHIEWSDSLDCVLRSDLVIQRLRFSEKVIDEADDCNTETLQQQVDADWSIMTGVLREFLESLVDVFGRVEAD